MWVYDVALAVVLAQVVSLVEQAPPARRPGWWSGVVGQLRVHATVGDLAFDLDLGLTGAERVELAGLLVEAADQLLARGVLTTDEAADWTVLDDQPVIFRGRDPVDTGPFAELGYALAQLIRGTLPAPPPGSWWFYGAPGGRRTIATGDADGG
jgi:hypothetical protein